MIRQDLVEHRTELMARALDAARKNLRPGEEREMVQQVCAMLQDRLQAMDAELSIACRELHLPTLQPAL